MHYSVLVIGDDVDKELAPFQEYNGDSKEYTKLVDITEEKRNMYETYTLHKLKSPEGELFEPWKDMFYREPTEEEAEKIKIGASFGVKDGISYCSKDWGDGKGFRPKVAFVPEGWESLQVPAKELYTFIGFLNSYLEIPYVSTKEEVKFDGYTHTWEEIDRDTYTKIGEQVTIYRCTNPNGKWDWYQTGGRWSGLLIDKNGEKCDSCLVKDLDMGKTDQVTIDWFRSFWENNQDEDPVVKNFHGIDCPLEEYLEKKGITEVYAVIQNGKWREESDGKTIIIRDIVKDLGPNDRVTIVDIHS